MPTAYGMGAKVYFDIYVDWYSIFEKINSILYKYVFLIKNS